MSATSPRMDEDPSKWPGWQFVNTFLVLGHRISCMGSHEVDLAFALKSAWRAYWRGAGNKKHRKVSFRARWLDVHRTVWPCIAFRCSWWSYTAGLGARLDWEQRRLVACMMRLPRNPGEELAPYLRRRSLEAGRVCSRSLVWSELCAQRVVNWAAHLERRSAQSWATQAWHWRGSAWYEARRMLQNSRSAFGGKLGMRVSGGRPRTRFHDGVRLAASLPVVQVPKEFEQRYSRA